MSFQRLFRTPAVIGLLLTIHAVLIKPTLAATLPPGFTEVVVATGLSSPTAMQFAPDGRLFVCEQGGRLRVIKNGSLLSAPFVTLTVNSSGERGLLGVAFDPNFATNHFVYVYYTATSPTVHNRISRFTANGDVAVAGSEVVIFDLDNLSSATNHNGGALAFGPLDGKLYAAVGENGEHRQLTVFEHCPRKNPPPEQRRNHPDGQPVFRYGERQESSDLGARAPQSLHVCVQSAWSRALHQRRGRDHVGGNQRGPRGRELWLACDRGSHHESQLQDSAVCVQPLERRVCDNRWSVLLSLDSQFPSDYIDDYFFADYCGGWIRKLDRTAGNSVTTFATGIPAPVDLESGRRRESVLPGTRHRSRVSIQYGASGPAITSHPASKTVAPGASVTFSVRASGPAPSAISG